MRLELGMPVTCSDGPYGRVADVVVDPVARRLTHLVVDPAEGHQDARLVPIELVGAEGGPAPGLTLRCTGDEVRGLAKVQEFAYLRLGELPVTGDDWEIGLETMLAEPFYPAAGPDFMGGPLLADQRWGVVYDRIPKGEVEMRRRSRVTSSDEHDLGRIDGFVIAADGSVTHVVLERGHAWRRREVTIPIDAVAEVGTDAVRLNLTREAVGALEPVPVHRWRGAR